MVKPVESVVEVLRTETVDTTSAASETLVAQNTDAGADSLRGELFFQQSLTQFRVLAFQNLGGGGGGSTVDQGKVDAAVGLIQEKLDDSGLFDDVTHGELQEIERAFAGLNPDEANAVFNRLSDDNLRKWVDELGSNGWFGTGGFDGGEKTRLFDMLAGKLDGNNLNRLASHLGGDDLKALGRSVAAHGSDAAKEAFVRAQAARAETDPAAAVAVAEVIGSMRNNPAALERTLAGLSQSQINKIVEGATQERWLANPMSGGATVFYDAAPLGRMLDAVASVRNPGIKAAFFEPAAAQLKKIEDAGGTVETIGGIIYSKGDSVNQIRNGLTNILNSDTTGVVGALERSSRDGKGLTMYVKSMINGGQTQALGEMIARLQTGNGKNENAVRRFGEVRTGSDGRPYYDNAENLGYFMGAVHAAVKDISGDRDKQANIIKNIFGAVLGAVGAKNPATGVVASALNGLTSSVVDAVTDSLKNGDKDLLESLRELAFPRDGRGETYEGGAETAYDSAVGRVIDAHP
jgi:hypothetical protein